MDYIQRSIIMRKIEQQMNLAVSRKIDWSLDNTRVEYQEEFDLSKVFLHGHHIATYEHTNDLLDVNTTTLRNWPTNTTKSRLRALGADLVSRKGKLFLNGKEV
jgi:hypothetical protein